MSGCVDCEYFRAEYASYEEGGYLEGYFCEERPFLANLKTFPFKKQMSCFTLNFWLSEFAEMIGDPDDDSTNEAFRLWREKYWKPEEIEEFNKRAKNDL